MSSPHLHTPNEGPVSAAGSMGVGKQALPVLGRQRRLRVIAGTERNGQLPLIPAAMRRYRKSRRLLEDSYLLICTISRIAEIHIPCTVEQTECRGGVSASWPADANPTTTLSSFDMPQEVVCDARGCSLSPTTEGCHSFSLHVSQNV